MSKEAAKHVQDLFLEYSLLLENTRLYQRGVMAAVFGDDSFFSIDPNDRDKDPDNDPEGLGGRVVFNHLLQGFRAMLSDGTMNVPSPQAVITDNAHTARRLQGRVNRLLAYFVRQKGYTPAAMQVLAWTFLTGTGWMGVRWDMSTGPIVPRPKLDKNKQLVTRVKAVPVLDEEGQEIPGVSIEQEEPVFEAVRAGDLRFFAPNPMQLTVPSVDDPTDLPWALYTEYIYTKELKEYFHDEDTSFLVPDCGTSLVNSEFVGFSAKGWGRFGFQDVVDNRTSTQLDKMTRVHTYWEKPTTKYPDGRHLIVACDHVLWESDTGLCGGKVPVYPVFDTLIPGTVYGAASAENALPAQMSMNAAESELWTNRRLSAQGTMFTPEGALKKGNTRLNKIAGAIVEISKQHAGWEPKMTSVPAVSADLASDSERLRGRIDALLGVHGPTYGSNEGLNSGRQAAVLAENDRRKWGPTIAWLAMAVEGTCNIAINLWGKYAEHTTNIPIFGQGYSPTGSEYFVRDWLENANIQVYVNATQMMPYSPELRRQAVMEMVQVGALPVEVAHKAVRSMGLGLDEVMGSDEPSRATQLMEYEQFLSQGQPAPTNVWDDNAAHMDVLLEIMRAPSFLSESEEVKRACMLHLQGHVMAMSENNADPSQKSLHSSETPGNVPGKPAENLPPTMNGAQGAFTRPGESNGPTAV